MGDLKESWPIIALVISIAFNLYQSGKTREANKEEKETEAINELKREVAKVNTSLTSIRSDLDSVERDVKENTNRTADLGAFKERVDNTRASLSEIKAQVTEMLKVVQALLTQHSK